MHIKNPFRSGKAKSAEDGKAWSLQDLVGGAPAATVHHGRLASRIVTIVALLLITAGVGFMLSEGGFLGTNLIRTGSGSVATNACDYARIQGGMTDPCDPVAGLACAADNQCRCKTGTWDGRQCGMASPPPDLRVRVPDFATCGPRCSTRYAAVSVSYLSQNADCAVPVIGSETYVRDCACADGTEAYADFSERCAQEKLAAPLLPDGTIAQCADPMCASGGSCVCCNGSTAADCSLSCPGSSGPVSDCSACGPSCSLASDGASCACAPLSACPNGATDVPTCTACPIGLIGSQCASAPNACGNRNTGEILSSCECSAIAPDDADCPAIRSSSSFNPSLGNVSGMTTPVRFALEMKKAGYADGRVEFDVDFAFTNTSAVAVILSRAAADFDRPFGGMASSVSGISGTGIGANSTFDGRLDDELLGSVRKAIAPGATARISMTIAVETADRQLQWEIPVSLVVEIPSTGEKMSYDPAPAGLGLLKRPATIRPASTAVPVAASSGGPLEFGMLRGSVFHDTNANGQRDGGERGMGSVKVVVTDGNGVQQALSTDVGGQYETLVVAGKTSVAVSSDNPVLGDTPVFTSPSFSESFVAPGNIVAMRAVGVSFASGR